MDILACIIIFTLKLHSINAVIAIDFDENLRDCGNGLPLPDVDISQFNILPQEDGTLLLNGTVTVKKTYGDPTRWNMYSERLEQGNWNPGMISRDIPNLCPLIKMPSEPWYPYTKHLKDLQCPLKANYVEHMDNLNIGNMGTMLDVPPTFIGEWRIYHEITTLRNGFPVKECLMIPTTVSEV